MTGHFTDFIAATMPTPDHPDAQLFNPNTTPTSPLRSCSGRCWMINIDDTT